MAVPSISLDRPKAREDYLNVSYSLKSWLLTIDHKRIAILYLVSVTLMFLLGGFAAALIRLELLTPQADLLQSEMYNRTFTMHGIVMVFFYLIPAIPAVLGNFLIPLMVGARDMAFPRLNLMSWYVYVVGSIFTLYALVVGGLDTGWTFYTPYSTQYSTGAVIATGVGIFIVGFASVMTALNIIVTVHKMRAPGMTWFRLPLFVWSMYATSLIIILGTPVIGITVLLLAAERIFGVGIFDPTIGGDPILFQHLFWFYSHPAVYIMILPSMGVISEVIANMARKRIFGYRFVAFSSVAIAVFGFLVWGHHMFTSGQSVHVALVFSILSFLVAIPSAIKMLNWSMTLYKGSVSFQTPMIYALGFLGLFTIGGLTGLFLAAIAVDVHVHDTYFVVAHFHYVMVGGTSLGYLAGLHFWWPKMTGRMYNELWGKIAAATVFIGFNLTFFPQFIVGFLGMPRRYHVYAPEFQILNVFSSAGALILAIGFVMPLFYLIPSLWNGKRVGNNPWGAAGLEWETSSPPPPHNFVETPIVTVGAYNFGPVEEKIG